MEFRDCFDNILKEVGDGPYKPEIEKAKYEFFNATGVVHEDSDYFVERMNLFLDWYVFDRQLDKDDLTPMEYYYEKHSATFSNEERSFFEGMKKNVNSLFFVKSVNKERVKVKDMFTGTSYEVRDNYVMNLVSKGDVFQGRLIPLKKKNIFSRGFCFHPQETVGYIRSEISKIQNMGQTYHVAFMARLALMRVKTNEYSHVPVSHIYNEQPKIKF